MTAAATNHSRGRAQESDVLARKFKLQPCVGLDKRERERERERPWDFVGRSASR